MPVLFLICALTSCEAAAQECVVLLSGVAAAPLMLMPLQHRLKKDGYYVWNKGYSPTTRPIAESSQDIGRAMDDCIRNNAQPVDFVTHSMGGLLVRAYFQNHGTANAGRVVMLGPPNHGSELVDRIKDRWWFRFLTGAAGQELGTAKDSTPNRFGPISLEVGIIACRGDSFASEDSVKLDEMKDYVELDCSHTTMQFSPKVYQQVRSFLQSGRFAQAAEAR